ncbi:hypothetical protein [Riemerella anatipestifer]|uniref:Uncharacterized protein n=1 Tax=Riemerella anatipestifer RA-CH-1 TaxID=1228997 RepID=J9QYT4_RIEAN|nr:hypothetical protein [Riemerella anatipestifer]AFR35665.1 hypothetical protein B739_1066 [Riemerella anatipestifer RA-CH-1]MCO7332869.1 hypothetical protein [Riemerella anatipestifer]MCO7351760.1 hypothetical protein [Riemerella anatipestifer]MCU7583589.1 hypothetical protein [Riemerella anatipestifer]MCW0487001.1 hypothetical protein [Riemerella anatipestifer]
MRFQNVNEISKTLDGTYENSERNILQLLDRKLLKDTLSQSELLSYNKFSIKIKGKKLQISLFNNDGQIINREYKYAVQDNIYYLKNQNVKPLLIPYLAGAIDEKRLYLFINKKDDLTINVFESRSGALLFIGFLDWNTNQKSYNYKRIE